MSAFRSALRFVYKYKWRFIIGAVIALPLIAIIVFAVSPTKPSYVTQPAVKGDLRQTVEAVGTVISERDLSLKFSSVGVVSNVYVKEGDVVKAGQRLAALRAGNLAASVASASAQLKSAQAALEAKMEGATPEDIAVSQADVASKQAALQTAQIAFDSAKNALDRANQQLDALNSQATIALSGDISGVSSTVTKELTTSQNVLSVVKSIFSNNDISDAISRTDSATYSDIVTSMNTANTLLNSLYAKSSPADFEAALSLLDQTRNAVNQSLTVVSRSFNLVNQIPATESFTEADRNGYTTQLATQRNTMQTALNDIDAESKSLRDASASYETQIASEQASVTSAQGAMDKAKADITTYQASLQISQAQLQLKQAPTRKTDLDAAQANVQQARAALARAQADYSDTILTAPVAGKITKVAVKVGEFTPTDAAITMLGNSPFRVEMYVSEIDIPKVHLTQTGSIDLDAFKGTPFALHVSDVDSASTDRDGVPKYRVRLDFNYPHTDLKIGMTGDASIVTGIEKDAVSVPLRAVLQRDDGTSYVRIMKKDGTVEERTVTTGLEGEGGYVQVTGVQEGETVIVLEKK